MRSRASGGSCGDSVAAASPETRSSLRQVHLAQLDRRAGKRSHDRGRVVRIHQQAQPGEQVAHLRTLEQRPTTTLPAGGLGELYGRDPGRDPGERHKTRIRA